MSKVSEERRNWLEEVKADSEALTRQRLAVDLPKMEQEVAARQEKEKIKEARAAGVMNANVPPTQPIVSDGQPDQGELKESSSDASADSEELAKLRAENKALKSKNTKLENKLGKTAPDSEEVPEGDKPEESESKKDASDTRKESK
jgi:hypothetical protein